jgi:hypothetical protein
LYRGEIVHKDKPYPGQHDAIVAQVLWDEVQAILASNRIERAVRSKAATPSLLTGLVYDASGAPMSPTHAVKNGTRYRYYVSQSLIKGGRREPLEGACRVPAADLERLVGDRICSFVKEPAAMLDLTRTSTVATQKALLARASDFAQRWPDLPPYEKRGILSAWLSRVEVRAETIEIVLSPSRVIEAIRGIERHDRPNVSAKNPTTVLTVPARVKRTGMANKLVIEGKSEIANKPDRSLLRLIAQARHFSDLVMTNKGRMIKDLAVEARVSPSYFTRVFRLSFLAPEITKAILQGRHPAEFSAIKLTRAGQFALRWPEQRREFGFD